MFRRLVLPCVLLVAALPTEALGMDPAFIHEVASLHERSLDLVFVDVEGTVPSAFPRMAREASAVLERLGVRTRWRRGGHGIVASQHEITVVLMNSTAANAGVAPHVLGATLVGERTSRTVWIYLPHVAAALGLGARLPPDDKGDEVALLGTALGRVAAHEIIHALVPKLPHSRR
ncbi:MAG TPA: hypothetical protein VFO85_06850, partial [Vicinamibacteria bacterium]|nr:hypothetical protein [Vicinamibacteria bacterium]